MGTQDGAFLSLSVTNELMQGVQTPYHFRVTAKNSPNYEFSHVFKNGSILYKNSEKNDLTKRFDSYAGVTAEYSFCIENLNT